MTTATGYTVGAVARLAGVTVRTLHHYDEVGLVRPSGRTDAGYRLYEAADLERLRDVLSYRELGFTLEQIAQILDDPRGDTVSHLREQHRLVQQRIDRLHDVLSHLEKLMEAEQMGINLTPEEQLEVFGENWLGEQYAAEAEAKWGDTEAWQQSQRRTATLSKDDWVEVKASTDALERGLAEALAAGVPANDPHAMDLAERHRLGIETFYDCPYAMHRGLGDMYLADQRFTLHYEDVAPGLAQYLRDAIHANADRHEE
ncbi:MerR family transcriptional regulator [Angustibacter sp. Root456]|uniref:MerR family transcriptional regulator n=1 Tax=Angustibacter sp. Root456 TaxID=1736539 RepID=UPI0006FC3CF6|nr:MerR family transcriptional regulator [Angustibacter sp. Root456]KQX63680.1 transcriptional regulator [Angustibacter sp. Root456]